MDTHTYKIRKIIAIFATQTDPDADADVKLSSHIFEDGFVQDGNMPNCQGRLDTILGF